MFCIKYSCEDGSLISVIRFELGKPGIPYCNYGVLEIFFTIFF